MPTFGWHFVRLAFCPTTIKTTTKTTTKTTMKATTTAIDTAMNDMATIMGDAAMSEE